MDKLIAFIKSLDDANIEDICYYYYVFRDLLREIEIDGAIKLFTKNTCGIRVDNICVNAGIYNGEIISIDILINNRYIRYSSYKVYGRILQESPESAINCIYGARGGYFYINTNNATIVDDFSINWLLNQYPIKSARN